MTVIAAKKTENGVQISWDSFSGGQFHKGSTKDLQNLDKRIIGANFQCLVTGSASDAGLLKLFAKNNGIEKSDEISIIDYMIRFKEWAINKKGEPVFNLGLIFVADGNIFITDVQSLLCLQVKEFATMGAGGDFATTALHLGHSAEDACKIACELSNHCLEPVHAEVI